MTSVFKKKASPLSLAVVFVALGVFLIFSDTLDSGFTGGDDGQPACENLTGAYRAVTIAKGLLSGRTRKGSRQITANGVEEEYMGCRWQPD